MTGHEPLSDAESRRLERLVRAHAGRVHSFLLYRTADPDLVEDLVADTFERAIRARRHFDPRRGSERNWLLTIALNLLRDHARRRGAENRANERAGVAEERTDFSAAAIERQTLLGALTELPADEREALALVYGADLTAAQAARTLNLPLTTVQGRVYRGLKRLRANLGDDAM